MNSISLTKLVVLTFLCVSCVSCVQEEVKRAYEEVVLTPASGTLDSRTNDPHAFLKDAPSMSNVPNVVTGSVTQPALSWKTPPQWDELPGGGMRLAAFTSRDTNNAIDCSIIALSGSAGGVKANIGRWMRQIEIPMSTEEDLDKFISKLPAIKTKDGFPVSLVDLSALQSQADASKSSMMAAVLEQKDMTIFIKMTGTRASVIQNKSPFETLIKSLTVLIK